VFAYAKVDRSIIIGRSKICDIVINNENMSRQHLIIEYSDDSFYVQDLSTKNGTFFNGVRMTHKRRLEKGDVLKIGDLELIIRW
jgi:pSer/pThr/pTyr-binding forkhead associated (FHA) protein